MKTKTIIWQAGKVVILVCFFCLFCKFVQLFCFDKAKIAYVLPQIPSDLNSLHQISDEDRDLILKSHEICSYSELDCINHLSKKTLKELATIAFTDELRRYDGRYYYDAFEKMIPLQWRKEKFTILEFGVYQGNSLWMWRHAFPEAKIIGVDFDGSNINLTGLCQVASDYRSDSMKPAQFD